MNPLFILLLLVWAHTAQAMELSVSVQPQAATIGDRISYTVLAKDAKGTSLPQKLENPGPFEMLDVKTAEEDGTKTVTFTLTVFKTGKLALPAYAVDWVDANGKPQSMVAPQVFVEIISVLKEADKEPKLMDIEREAQAQFEWREYVWPAAILLALIAAALAVWYYLRKRKPPPVIAKEEIKLLPYQAALKKLEAIERDRLYDRGRVKEYFSGISDTVREYLLAEYGINAPEKTTRELEQAWPPMLEAERRRFFGILDMSDDAKFAKIIPTSGDAAQILRGAYDFLKDSPKVNSRPPEPPPASR